MENLDINSIDTCPQVLNFICNIINTHIQTTLYDPAIPLSVRNKNYLYLKHKIDNQKLQDKINKEKKNINKNEKKKIIKPKILKVTNYKEPDEFTNDYQYFIYIARQLKLDYYKYKSSCFWEGPAIILDLEKYNKNQIANIKYTFKININYDFLKFNQIAIFPKKNLSVEIVNYQLNYNYPESNEKIFEVIEWNLNDQIFLLDTSTNDIYDFNTEYYLGKRNYDAKNQLWSIQYLS